MNPHSDCTPTKKQTKALHQAQRLEQSSDTVQRRSARTNQAVQEHESEQRAAAREVFIPCAAIAHKGFTG